MTPTSFTRPPRNRLCRAANVARRGPLRSLVPSKSAQADLEPLLSAPLTGSREVASGVGA